MNKRARLSDSRDFIDFTQFKANAKPSTSTMLSERRREKKKKKGGGEFEGNKKKNERTLKKKKNTNMKDQGVSRMDILQALQQSLSFLLLQFA
jgi:hypothetical protein